MLDDLGFIHEKDVEDALGVVAKQAEQLRISFTLTGKTDFGEIHNIVFTGMGGSALAALLFRTWPGVNRPFEVVRDYELPAYVGPTTLVIASSYSGNTEETLSALADAAAKGAQIAVITGGGKLQAEGEAKNYAMAVLPKIEQPRYAILSSFKALLTILEQAGLLADQTVTAAADEAADFLDEHIKSWLPTVPTAQNPAKQLAQEIIGKSLVIYAGPKMFPAAYKWKISCNENAKHVAWTNQLPEFNHNEFIGWSKQPVDKPYVVVDLRSSFEHPRVQKRFAVTERLLSGLRPSPHVVEAQGETLLEQLLWTSAFGDFVTIYLALLSGIDPAPVDLVEKFKKALDE